MFWHSFAHLRQNPLAYAAHTLTSLTCLRTCNKYSDMLLGWYPVFFSEFYSAAFSDMYLGNFWHRFCQVSPKLATHQARRAETVWPRANARRQNPWACHPVAKSERLHGLEARSCAQIYLRPCFERRRRGGWREGGGGGADKNSLKHHLTAEANRTQRNTAE